MELRIKKLSSGFLTTVTNEEGEVIDQFASSGRWNLFPKISEYLFTKEENARASKGKATKRASKKSKKKVIK